MASSRPLERQLADCLSVEPQLNSEKSTLSYLAAQAPLGGAASAVPALQPSSGEKKLVVGNLQASPKTSVPANVALLLGDDPLASGTEATLGSPASEMQKSRQRLSMLQHECRRYPKWPAMRGVQVTRMAV